MPPPELAERATLERTLAALGLPAEPAVLDRLQAYLALLQRWNATYNLTAIREPAQMLGQHLADCLAVVPPLQRQLGETAGRRLVDVGSGGGLPGVVLTVLGSSSSPSSRRSVMSDPSSSSADRPVCFTNIELQRTIDRSTSSTASPTGAVSRVASRSRRDRSSSVTSVNVSTAASAAGVATVRPRGTNGGPGGVMEFLRGYFSAAAGFSYIQTIARSATLPTSGRSSRPKLDESFHLSALSLYSRLICTL